MCIFLQLARVELRYRSKRYNNFLVSRNHQKEEQIQREKEMAEIRRQKEQEQIESTSVDISLMSGGKTL